MNNKIIMEHVECDLCGCNEYIIRYRAPDMWLWINQFEFPVVECRSCGLVFVNPRPTQESMSKYYPKDYHKNRNTNEELLRYKNQAQYLPNLDNKVVIDIGCARGDFLHYLHEMHNNMTAYGVDYFSNNVDFKEINFYNKLFFKCAFKDSFFDVVTSFAVFEHLHEPSLYFKESARVLKKNGELIILVTNSESLYSKKAYIEDIPRHTYHFSEKSLKKYGEKYNLELKNIYYDDDIFDGRGTGAIKWYLSNLLNIKFEDYYFKKINIIQRIVLKIGTILDKIVFTKHWERNQKKSGIIIARFLKK